MGVYTCLKIRWPHTTLSKINDSDVIDILQDPQSVFAYIHVQRGFFYQALAMAHTCSRAQAG